MKKRKIKYQQFLNGCLCVLIVKCIFISIFTIILSMHAQAGELIDMDFSSKFPNILSDQQKLIAKDQIYSSVVGKNPWKTVSIILAISAVILIALVWINMYSTVNNVFELNKESFFHKYLPEILTATLIGALIIPCIYFTVHFARMNCSQYCLNSFSVSLDSLNLSSNQFEQFDAAFKKMRITILILASIMVCILVAGIIGVVVAINTGSEYKIDQKYEALKTDLRKALERGPTVSEIINFLGESNDTPYAKHNQLDSNEVYFGSSR